MSRLFFRRNAVCCAVLLAAAGSLAQSGGQIGSITGKVADERGQALQGVTVTLATAENGEALKVASTGADGNYRLVGVGYGRYRLSATMAGYRPSASRFIELAEEAVAVNFELQPVLPANPANGGFMGDDGGGTNRPSFRASGIEGATAPSGYSAAASADDAAVVMARVNSLEDAGPSLISPSEAIPECNRESDLLRAVQVHPESFESNHQLGVFYFGHGEVAQSVGFLRSASLIQPLDLNNARWLSLAYVRTGQSAKAVDLIRLLVKQRPRDPAPSLLLAEIYDVTGDRPKSVAQYSLASALDGGEGNLFACGVGLVSLGAAQEAMQLFSQGTIRNPGSARLWMGLGIAQSLINLKAESARSLMRAADLDPEYLPTYFFLATLSGTSNEMDAAIGKRLEVLVVANAQSAEAHYDYALALWKHGRLDSSVQPDAQINTQLKLAIEKDPTFPAAHLKLGTIYEEARDYPQAVTELERAVQLDPDNATAHYRLAQAYRHNNQPGPADVEMATFKKMRSAPLGEDDSAQEGVRLYTAQQHARLPAAVLCHEPR